MSLRCLCAASLSRGSAAVKGRPWTATKCLILLRQPARGFAVASSAPVQHRIVTPTAAVAGCVTAAALSLLLLAADDSAGHIAEADDGSLPADRLSPAPTPAAVGSAADSHDSTAQHSTDAKADAALQQSSYTQLTAGSGSGPAAGDHPAAATAAAAGVNQPSSSPSLSGKPRLLILGSGWGAVSLLKGLDRDAYEVTVISPRNYFLFTPLLPSATTGQVESRTLMEPIRRICHRIKAHYFEGKAVDVDCSARLVTCRGYNGHEFTVPYDHLVLAVGAKNNTFGVDGADEYTYFLKVIISATLR